MLIPVLFSDLRIDKKLLQIEDSEKYPIRKTYVEIDDVSVPTLKTALSNRNNVFVSENKNDDEFVIFPDGTTASTGLNVVVGKRASGKTYLLNSINKSCDEGNAKYIEQFYISKNSDKDEFKKLIDSSYDNISETYLSPLKSIIEAILDIDISKDEKKLQEYLDSLKDNAQKRSTSNIFSKTKIFNETLYSPIENTELTKLIEAIKTIIDSQKYKTIITEFVELKNLKMLFIKLVEQLQAEKLDNLLKNKADIIVNVVKKQLELKATIPAIKEFKVFDTVKNKTIIDKFNGMIKKLREPTRITRFDEQFYGFKIEASKKSYSSPTEVKGRNNINKQIAISEEYEKLYDVNPLEFIRGIKDKGIPLSSLHRLLINVEVKAKGELGNNVSGGQKAEFVLLKQLANATDYDILLIDEPESSFDNLFIKEKIIRRLQDISLKTTTFLTTHNNSLGISIFPKKIIYTRNNNDDTYDIFTGSLTSKKLKSKTGAEIPNYSTILDVMEAGETTYIERNDIYEHLKN